MSQEKWRTILMQKFSRNGRPQLNVYGSAQFKCGVRVFFNAEQKILSFRLIS